MEIVPCLTWVRRGIAKKIPDKIKLDEDELKRIIEETKEELEEKDNEDLFEDDEDDEDKGAAAIDRNPKIKSTVTDKSPKKRKRKHENGEKDDIETKYELDDYDDDKSLNPMQGIGSLSYYASQSEDPYITIKDDDSDVEDFEIMPSDNLVVCGKAEQDACLLEIYVYNEDLGNFYCHHDILLPSFPLAVEWLNYDVGEDQTGNFVAVGTMEPVIDIWDLDIVDCLEPCATLGSKRKKKTKKKVTKLGHTDAVLDLSWNSLVRNALASASADYTVGLWDLSVGKIVTSVTQNKEKVQCVKWHPREAQSLLSGSFDHTVKVYDCRNPNEDYKSWDVEGEVERVLWNPYSPMYFYAVTDSGSMYYLDSRQDKPVYTLSAHTEAITGVALSSSVPGLLVTTSVDKSFKVWDVHDNKPSLVLEKDLQMGKLNSLGACPEAPFVFAIGAEKDVKIWDIRESAAVRKHFESRTGISVAEEEDGARASVEHEAASALDGLSIDNSNANSKKKKKKRRKKKSQLEETN